MCFSQNFLMYTNNYRPHQKVFRPPTPSCVCCGLRPSHGGKRPSAGWEEDGPSQDVVATGAVVKAAGTIV